MIRIEATGIVDENGTMTLSVPANVPPGPHDVVVVIDHGESASLPSATDDTLEQQGTRLVFTGEVPVDPEFIRRSLLEERERRFIGDIHP